MRKKKRLALIVKNVDGGTGTYLLTFQKLGGFEIKNFVLEAPKYRRLPPSNKKNTVFFSKKGFYPSRYFLSLRSMIDFLKEFLWLQKNILSFDPDAVISVDIHANLLTMLNKLFLGKNYPVILTTHINLEKTLTEKSRPLLKTLLTKIAGFLYTKADANVCVSKGVASSLKKTLELKKNPIVIYNGAPPVKNNKSRNNQKILLSLARFDEQKDHESIIKAFFLVQKKIANSQLWLGGEGPEKPLLQRLAKKLGLKDKVKFLGWINASFMPRADVFILSSKREGLPYALLEAMAAGLPVISTDTPFGPAEILENGKDGILVPPGNVEALAKAMLDILKDRRKASFYARKSRERSRFFSEEKMLSSYKQIILKLT